MPSPKTTTPAWSWATHHEGAEVRFLGRGTGAAVDLPLVLEPAPGAVTWLEQVHSNAVIEASGKLSTCSLGSADAVVTRQRGQALAIATADCVPILMVGPIGVAAVHAGWRGLVAGVLPAAIGRLAEPAAEIAAWIGPAIGPCCYEIGADVARRLADVAGGDVLRPGSGERPHADLQAVARHQLETAGIGVVHRIERCTRCHPDDLWSYRRDGRRAGRNWAVVWRR